MTQISSLNNTQGSQISQIDSLLETITAKAKESCKSLPDIQLLNSLTKDSGLPELDAPKASFSGSAIMNMSQEAMEAIMNMAEREMALDMLKEFTDNFFNITNGNVGQQAVINYTKDILARLLVKSWAEEERNLLLDIRGIMQDSDFKLLSSDRILKSKNEWVNQLDSEIYNYQNRLAWQIRFMNGSSKLGRG